MDELTAAEYRAFALRIALRDAPRTLTWVGNVVIVFALLNMAVPPPTPPPDFVGIVTSGLFMVALGRLIGRPTVRTAGTPWVFCGAITIVMAYLLRVYVVENDTSDLAYVLIGVTAYAPLSFAWRPYLTSGTVILALTHAAMASQHQPDRGDWLLAFGAAFVVGGVLLALRLRLLRELADAEAVIARRATTDPLTGLLSRQGLSARLPEVWGRAHRSGAPVSVWFLDVRGLKRANDEHGHEFGDTVLVDTARALRASVRTEDAVARWGGDEFVVLGVGSGDDDGDVGAEDVGADRSADRSADALRARIVAHLAADGTARRDWWSGDVTVGMAAAHPEAVGFVELLERADQDMYRRRTPGGGTPPPPGRPAAGHVAPPLP